MTGLLCRCELNLPHQADYMPQIHDRLESYHPKVEQRDAGQLRLAWAYGWLSISAEGAGVTLQGGAQDRTGLARIKDLLATAFKLYAKPDAPQIVWQGDGADDPTLAPFRLMEMVAVSDLGDHMKRLRLRGSDLGRFEEFGNMHVRLLLPTPEVPVPVWPIAGPDGLTLWPEPARKAVPRVYTIRAIDTAAGWVDIDMVTHGTEGPGSAWALTAQPGDQVGMFGPLGRPINRNAAHYILGADETGLPALARMLEILPAEATGLACIEVGSAADIQPLANRTQIAVEWLFRREKPAGTDPALAARVMAQDWRADLDCFGWFAAEDSAARLVRGHWRQTLGLERTQTLVASYWRRGATGLMAG